jgi:HlyD family secretion protein
MKKIFLVILALFVGGGWWYYRRTHNEQFEYLTARVDRAELTQAVTATGTLNPVVLVTIGSQISGNVLKLFADFNSKVKAGQLIAQIDPAVYVAVVHQCEGDLAMSKAALELTQVTAKRKQELADQHAAPQADLDAALANLHQAEATITIKDANLEKAKLDLEHCNIYSPINGSVILRSVDVGQTVAAAMNAPVLFTVAKDLTDLQIDSAVAEADVGIATVGQTVDFTVDAFPYTTFHGRVGQVRNAASTVQNVVTYDVVITVKNPDLKLLPGMTANIAIVVAHKDDALRVPNAALRFRMPEREAQATPTPAPAAVTPRPGRKAPGPRIRPPQQRSVYVMSPGAVKPHQVTVKLGISDGIFTEVTEGVNEGDLVVTSASMATSRSGPSAPNPFSGHR